MEVSTDYTLLPEAVQLLIGEFAPLDQEFLSVPEWIRAGNRYPDGPEEWDEDPDYIEFATDSIPQAIGQAYTPPYPFALVFEIYRPKPRYYGDSPRIPYIRLVCVPPFYRSLSSAEDQRPIAIVPTGSLLNTDPRVPYLVAYHPVVTGHVGPLRVSFPISRQSSEIPHEQLRLLCPCWLPHQEDPDWKQEASRIFAIDPEIGRSPYDLWYRLDNPKLQRLQWIIGVFLQESINQRDFQLRRYLPLYPGNKYQEKVDSWITDNLVDRNPEFPPPDYPAPPPPPPPRPPQE